MSRLDRRMRSLRVAPEEARLLWARHLPYVHLGLRNLAQRKVRSLLTMLGMIFGVAAVVAMLAIGAGAREQVMSVIEQLGVRNLIVEADEPGTIEQYQRLRQTSPGLSFQDYRVMRANLPSLVSSSARKRVVPGRVVPRPERETPIVFGVSASFRRLTGLRVMAGRFFEEAEGERAAPVCVLGDGARGSLFGDRDPVGESVRFDEQWFRVIGVVAPEASRPHDVAGLPAVDRDNLVYVPLSAAMLRLSESQAFLHDEIDAVYLELPSAEEAVRAAPLVRGILNATHRATADFRLIVPSELLAQQRRTQWVFEAVTVAIAAVSLLVGGIGIMNIMLASVLERTREVGIRRAVGATRGDIVRQFLIEAVLIALLGGAIGVVGGIAAARLIALVAGWSTVVTPVSILLAFLVSVGVGLASGLYPALAAARLDPVQAIRS
jgi:putative ABC transport system permease protein